MKVLFIVNLFPAISETFILSQITGLIELGVEVDILARVKGEFPQNHRDLDKYNLLDRTYYYDDKISNMPEKKLHRLVVALYCIVKNFFKKPTAILKSLNFVKLGKHALNFEALYRTLLFLEKGPYDIVHCHFGPNGYLALYLKDIGALDGKIITTFYGFDISTYVRQNGKHAYTLLFERGDQFLSISEDMTSRLVQLGCDNKKINILKLGVDMERFGCQEKLSDKQRKVRLLSVGRFVEKKGFEFSIRAVANVAPKYPKIEYFIIGDGDLKDELIHLIEKLNVSSFVTLLGWQTQDEVGTAMAESDIFIAPSVTATNGDKEGTPTVLIEASARCLPVISTLHAGNGEVIQDGTSGFLVPEKDVNALTAKLQYLIENPQRWPEMGRAGRLHVQEHHDKNVLNTELINIYRKMTGADLTAS